MIKVLNHTAICYGLLALFQIYALLQSLNSRGLFEFGFLCLDARDGAVVET